MRRAALFGSILLGAAAPAGAQAIGGFAAQQRSDARAIAFGNIEQARIKDRQASLTTPSAWRPADEDRDVGRASAWGRCVVRSAPDGGAAYLAANRTAWRDPERYHAAFQACRDHVGRFGQDHRPMVLRAAIADARREARQAL